MRGAVGYARVFTFLICRGCNVCDRDRKRVYGKNINQWMGKYVGRWWISLVWVCINVNVGIMMFLKMESFDWCIFMHKNADVSCMKQALAIGMIVTMPRSKVLVFFDADPRCWGIGWPLHLLGIGCIPEKENNMQRLKGPTSCCSGKPGASVSSHLGCVFVEEWQAMQIAPSAVFPLVFCFLWLFLWLLLCCL